MDDGRIEAFEAGIELRDSLNRLNVKIAGISVRLNAKELREAEELYTRLVRVYEEIYTGRENPEIFSELEVYRRQIEYLKGVIVIF